MLNSPIGNIVKSFFKAPMEPPVIAEDAPGTTSVQVAANKEELRDRGRAAFEAWRRKKYEIKQMKEVLAPSVAISQATTMAAAVAVASATRGLPACRTSSGALAPAAAAALTATSTSPRLAANGQLPGSSVPPAASCSPGASKGPVQEGSELVSNAPETPPASPQPARVRPEGDGHGLPGSATPSAPAERDPLVDVLLQQVDSLMKEKATLQRENDLLRRENEQMQELIGYLTEAPEGEDGQLLDDETHPEQ